jgi:thiol-disulfide isomerase/thioredoxin
MSDSKNTRKRKSNIIVCKVYADWCGACTAAKPEWDKMTKKLHKKKNVNVFEIEEKQIEPKLKELEKAHNVKIDVTGYPTIFKISNGKLSYYEKERSADKMSEWVLHGGNGESSMPNVLYDLQGGKRRIKHTRKNRHTRRQNSKRGTKLSGLLAFLFGK